MELTFTLTQKDLYDSYKAHLHRKWFGRWVFPSFLVFTILLSATLLVFEPIRNVFEDAELLYAVMVCWAIWNWAFPRWLARTSFRKTPSLRGPRTVLMDAAGVHTHWAGGSADVAWTNFIRFHESERLFLFYPSPRSFTIVPKRALTPEQIPEVRTLISRNIPV